MAKIPMYDPLTSEARSPLIAGLTEACNKLSSILELGTEEAYDMPLSNIYITDSNKYSLYQAPLGNKLWLEVPAPIIRKNGIVITPETDEFTIDYFGGSIKFDNNKQLEETDIITADFTYITDTSGTLENIVEKLEEIGLNANKFRGYYNDVTSAISSVKNPVGGDYFIVGGTENNIYIWNSTTKKWEPVYKQTDFSNYYNKSETNTLLANKEDTITPHGTNLVSDDYYYGGRKTWQSINDKVKGVLLTGVDTSNKDKVTGTDTVLSAVGKLQGQINDYVHDLFGTGNPTTSTIGKIGQDYTNTSTGDKFHLIEIASNGDYIWESYSNSTEMNNVKAQLNSALTQITNLDNEKIDKVSPATAGHLAILDADGNIVDSGKGVGDVGKLPTIQSVTLPTNGWISGDLVPKYTTSIVSQDAYIGGKVAYGNNKFVLHSTENTTPYVYYSTNGINWSKVTLPNDTYDTYHGVIYGNNKFILLPHTCNHIMYSENGINWTLTSFPVDDVVFGSGIYANGKFILMPYGSNKFVYSSDGINWTEGTLPITGTIISIAYGNNKFIAIDDKKEDETTQKLLYSNNGTNWTEISAPTPLSGEGHWFDIAYGNNKFVMPSSAGNVGAYSEDGINWEDSTLPDYGNWYNVTYGDGRFVAATYSDYISEFAYSVDGINWSKAVTPTEGKWNYLVYGDKKYVAFNNKNSICLTFEESQFSQTVSVNGVIANESQQIIRVSPDPIESNINQIMDCAVYCTAQGAGTLTFTAFDDKPTEDVVFNVEIQNL